MDPEYSHKCPYNRGRQRETSNTHTYMGSYVKIEQRKRFEDAGLEDWRDVTTSQGMLVVNRS